MRRLLYLPYVLPDTDKDIETKLDIMFNAIGDEQEKITDMIKFMVTLRMKLVDICGEIFVRSDACLYQNHGTICEQCVSADIISNEPRIAVAIMGRHALSGMPSELIGEPCKRCSEFISMIKSATEH